MTIVKSIKVVLFSALCAITLNACAEYKMKDEPTNQDKYLPFSIKFSPSGEPVVIDEKGNELVAQEAKFPLRATSIEKIEPISYVQYRGSHVVAIVIGGKMYLITIPD